MPPDLKLLNERIESALSSPNELMNRVVRSFLEKRGKQIRPIMVLLTAKLLGTVNDDVLAGAVAVELLHNASLIHDDVVDDTLTRRGNPTINGAWDNHLAVLMGDFFPVERSSAGRFGGENRGGALHFQSRASALHR